MAKVFCDFSSFEELINLRGVEVLSYIDRKSSLVKVETRNIVENLVATGEALMIPTCDDLCSYGRIMNDYLSLKEIIIPKGVKPIQYLYDNALESDFYEFRRNQLAESFGDWLEENQIEIEYA